MKNFLILSLFLISTICVQAQTANNFSSVVPYSGPFEYGMNPGWWGTQFNNPQLAQLAANAGSGAFRINLADFISGPSNGTGFNSDLTGYTANGLTNNVGFLGSVWANNQLDSTFPGCSSKSLIWRGTYLPIWKDSVNGVIDTANRFANYVYQMVTNTGSSIKYWEIINEMDFTYDWVDASGGTFNVTQAKTNPTSWWNVPPTASALSNLQAPVFYYIHMLKIAYNVIKRVQPNSYIAIGGIGYPSTLDVLMRYTDNPVDGSVTPQFPLTGGAYFDVVNFHTYPMYNLNVWSNTACPGGCFVWNRHSDFMIDIDTMYVHQYDSVQVAHGYNNSTYPKKIYISTETDAPQDSLDDGQWGSINSAINYTIKWNVACQAYGLTQLDKYALGSQPLTNNSSEFNHCGLYGDITPATTTVANAPKTQEFYGYKTMSSLLSGKKYDAAKTAAMNIPKSIRGYAFNDGAGNYTYVMWAKTTTDLSEGASATYTFPFTFSGTRMEWNYSSTNTTAAATQTVALTGNPSFFVASAINKPVTNAGTASGTVGTSFSYTITASNTPSSYAATGLPSGLTVNTSTGLISGTPTASGTFTVNISATNAGGTGTNTLTITINPPAPIISGAVAASGTTGTSFSYNITASNTPSSYTATGLPSGLTVNTTTGLISGTPTASGTFTVNISATNAGGTGTNTLTITINPPAPVISGAVTASGTTGTIFSYNITASNTPSSYTATGLPSGLTVNTSTGLISGTPTASGTFTVSISAINAGGTGTNTLTITINPPAPVISGAVTASGTTGTTFSYNITASNTPSSYTATGLPSGLTINTSTGLISGTPTAPGTFTVSISATNAGGTGTNTLTITINPPAPVISGAVTASGTTGTSFSYNITASNTPSSYTATGLPSGLTVNTTTGLISGTPTVSGTFTVSIGATNAGGTGTNTLTITVNPAAPVTNTGTASGAVGVSFTYTITASNTPNSYAATGLPSGLTINTSTGLISGIPIASGTSAVSISATNAGGTGTAILQITILAANIPPSANAGADQVITLPINSLSLSGNGTDVNGTITSYSWTQLSGPSIAAITNAASPGTEVTGLITGIYQFALTVTDNNGASGSDTVQVTVKAANISPTANAGTDQTITLPINSVILSGSGTDVDGTIASYQWSQIYGASATIVSTNSAGTSITNLVQGVYQFVLTVTDNSGATGSDTVQVTVMAANIPPTANAGINQIITLPTNSITLSGSGTDVNGTIASYQWSQISGASSTIVSANSASTSITNLVQGVYQFVLTVTDNNGATGKDTVQIDVNIAPIANAGTNQTITLPTNSVTLSGSGADVDGTVASYKWVETSGPSSASITSATSSVTSITGLVQGVYQFMLTVTDNDGAMGTSIVQIMVNAANIPPTANAGTNQVITLPTNSVTLNGSGTDVNGTIASYQWIQLSGPSSGSTTDANSPSITIAGLVQGVYQFVLTVTDNSGATTSDTVQVTVNAAKIAQIGTPVANAGADQVITVPTNSAILSGSATDAGGTITSYQWTEVSGPSSVSIGNASSALTSVTNLVQGVYQFQLTVTDNTGAVDADTMQVTVNAAQSLQVTAAPNPVQTSLTAQISNIYPLNQTLAVTIVNSNGTKVYSSTVLAKQSTQAVNINVSKLKSGIYLLNVKSNVRSSKFNVTTKIVKN